MAIASRRLSIALAVLCSGHFACGSDSPPDPAHAPGDSKQPDAGLGLDAEVRADAQGTTDAPATDLGLPPVAPGFVRYPTHPVTVAPGENIMWAEWVGPPLESDMDVVAVTGLQSKSGHHANLYATTDVQPVGPGRAWRETDQLAGKNLGGIGGEGGSAIELPPGVVFRVAKGSALMIQAHYLNTGTQPIDAVSVLDAKLTPVDPSSQVASTFANVATNFSIPPAGRATADTTCVVQSDLRFLLYANHMHDWGVSASTELINADGTIVPLKVDPVWDPSWAFHPIYAKFSPQAPQLIPAGSTLHTTCTWANNGSTAITFPDEMCIFGAFFIGGNDVTCANGAWH
jgi:hypothetical protein